MMSERIRVAVIGAGGIGKNSHIPAYLANSHADLVAVVDTDLKQLKIVEKKFKVKKTYTSVDDLFENQKIDAVSICTPPNTHAMLTIKAFKNGANVLCEKPMATSVDEGKKMIDAAKKYSKFFMVGFHRRFLPNYQKVRKIIKNGSLGHVYCIHDHFIEPNPLLGYSKSKWFFEPNVGGVILDIAPHVFDMLNYLYADFPTGISASSSSFFNSNVEDSFCFILEYPEGRKGIGTTSWLSPTMIENVNIYGTAKNVFVSPNFFLTINPNAFRQISLLKAATDSLIGMKIPNLPFIKNEIINPYKQEINYFIKNVRNNETSLIDALNGFSVLLTTEMAKRSIAEKKQIKILPPDQF